MLFYENLKFLLLLGLLFLETATSSVDSATRVGFLTLVIDKNGILLIHEPQWKCHFLLDI